MATETGRREIVTDPLARNARENSPDRSLQLAGVRAPMIPSAASLTVDSGVGPLLQGVEGILAQEFERKKDDWITEGKVAYQSGVTEQQILESGNTFTARGYRTLQARDQVNNWFLNQTIAMDESGKQQDPVQYAASLKEQRANMLNGISDPYAKKVAVAAFEEMSPRLATSQAIKHNEYNRVEGVKALSSVLYSTGTTSSTASTREPGGQLAVSPVPVGPVLSPSAKDRDIGIRTMLGEAGNQGAEGLAAVAHVMRNRTTDSRWAGTIEGVALAPKQFSTWNAGPGGNNIPYNAKPGSPIYERAGEIFDTVMAGKHVDPTGGATHYYSPAGMTKLVADGSQANIIPPWLKSEEAKSGGAVKIGGHIFVGKSNGTTVRDQASYDTKLSEGEEKTFQTWKAQYAPNDSGEDYDLRGAFKAGVTPDPKNGHWPDTYKKPNHETFSVESQYAVGVDRTKAGHWEGETFVPAHKQAGPQNEVQELLLRSNAKPEDKASALADALRRSLDAGDEKLFNDVGGVSALHGLKAKPGDIDEVIKARKRFDDKKSTEFNVENVKFEDEIKRRAESGEALDTILPDIQKRRDSGLLNDSNARALATGAADKIRAVGAEKASALTNPDLLGEIGGLYQAVATGSIEFKPAVEQAKAIAAKYGASEKDVQKLVGKIFSDDQERQNRMRAQATTLAKTAAEQAAVKGEVARSLSQGYGLKDAKGTVKITDDHGQPREVSAVEYGINQIKDKWAKQYSDAAQRGEITPGQAKMEIERRVMLELQNHGVVDPQTQAQLGGGLSGNIVAKDGTLKPGAKQAYDTYLTLSTTQGISPGYLSKVVGNDETRALLETAISFDAGDLSKEQALLKAHERLNDPNRNPNDRINKDVVWRAKLETEVTKSLFEKTAPGFWSALLGTADRSEQERILTKNTTAKNYVTSRAEVYHLQYPEASDEAKMKMAVQDLHANATTAMGNLIITKPGKELDTAMGVRDLGEGAADKAITEYVRKNAVTFWGKKYTEREPSSIIEDSIIGTVRQVDRALSPGNILAAAAPGKFGDGPEKYAGASPKAPPVLVTYNAELGVITVDLWKDSTMKQTIGKPQHIPVADIGAAYVKEQTTPGTWAQTWNTMFKGTVRAVKDTALEIHRRAQ